MNQSPFRFLVGLCCAIAATACAGEAASEEVDVEVDMPDVEVHAESCDVFDSNARSTWVASLVVTTLTSVTPTQIHLLSFAVP